MLDQIYLKGQEEIARKTMSGIEAPAFDRLCYEGCVTLSCLRTHAMPLQRHQICLTKPEMRSQSDT